MISVKIDLSKIDKSCLFQGKNGAQYLDIILRESRNDKYGNDWMVVQSVSKEARAAGKRGPILGNGKNFFDYQVPEPRSDFQPKQAEPPDDLPF